MANKKIKIDDFETKFSQIRIKHRTSSPYRELIKKYFLHENELCDWIIIFGNMLKIWNMMKL